MAYEIIWTDIAKEDFDRLVENMTEYYSVNYAIKFVNTFYKKLDLIALMPFLGVQSQRREGVRRLVITKNISLGYILIIDQIYLLRVFDTRRNPDDIEF
jgi:plasmid stabilization system protein ParE